MNHTMDLLTSGLPHTWTCNERTDDSDLETDYALGRGWKFFLGGKRRVGRGYKVIVLESLKLRR